MKSKTIAKTRSLRLKFNQNKKQFIMTGGKFGDHSLYEPYYNDRVSCHWEGYMINNGINWKNHPEFFPNEDSKYLFLNKSPRA